MCKKIEEDILMPLATFIIVSFIGLMLLIVGVFNSMPGYYACPSDTIKIRKTSKCITGNNTIIDANYISPQSTPLESLIICGSTIIAIGLCFSCCFYFTFRKRDRSQSVSRIKTKINAHKFTSRNDIEII
jgi:hypothetical protein